MYLGAIFWTVAYDTIYAIQDYEDFGGLHVNWKMFGDLNSLKSISC